MPETTDSQPTNSPEGGPLRPPSSSAARGKFVTGSTLRHVVTMTATGSIGLGSLFLVDVLNLFYISLLGQQELAAAVGYAGTLLFFITSLSIGLSIAATALVSRALGAGERHKAQQLSGASLLIMGGTLLLAALLVFPWLPELLSLLGARDATADLALRFCRIVLPSAPLLGLVMCLGALLRALGDGRRAMFVTLGGGLLTAVLDPLLIFGLGWGLDGAAVSTVLARVGMVVLGFYLLLSRHGLFAWPTRTTLAAALPAYAAIAFPAVLTQVATPVGNAFVTAAIAPFGDSAVAGWAVVVRVIPVAFVALFALSGSVGPILGQNVGAGRFDRLRSTLRDSLTVVLVYVLVVWLLLALGRGLIADAFGAQGEARHIIEFFCLFVAGSFFFNGALFVGNAAFNNLGFAFYSTALNWGRSTLGVVPFIWLGGQWFGAVGVLAGYGLGVVLFGTLAMVLGFRVVDRLGQSHAKTPHTA